MKYKYHSTALIQFAVTNMDGTPLNRTRRQVTINRTVRKVTGSTSGLEKKLVAKDNGIVRYRWIPEEDDEYILITVSPM